MSVSVVMPCYNEEEVIERVIRTYYNEIISKIVDSELIVVDDSSNDNTYNILGRLKSELPKLRVLKTPLNSGHGKAVRMGYESATGEYVFQADSDTQFEVKDFWKLYTLKEHYDFILGFRKKRHDSIQRLLLSKIICIMNFIIFGVWIKDANCPFRLIKKRVLDSLLEDIDKEALAPNIIISILAKKKRIKLKEVPVTHYQRKTGVSSLRSLRLINFSLKGFMQLLAMRRS